VPAIPERSGTGGVNALARGLRRGARKTWTRQQQGSAAGRVTCDRWLSLRAKVAGTIGLLLADLGAGMREEWEEIEERRQRSAENSKWIFGLGAVVALTFLTWTQFFGERREPAIIGPALEATVIEAPVIEVPPVLEGSAPTIPRSVPARTGRESYVGVYECTVNGQRVISDRPCAQDAQARTLVIDQPRPQDVALSQQQTWQAQRSAPSSASFGGGSSVQVPATSGAGSNAAACEAIDRAIDHLNARMRERYGAAEGERLRAQWHSLKQRRYDLKCGR